VGEFCDAFNPKAPVGGLVRREQWCAGPLMIASGFIAIAKRGEKISRTAWQSVGAGSI
jgi:hypothetical protein